MAEAKSRVPAIALALAVIAVGMLALAICMRTHRADVEPVAPTEARPPIDAAIPIDALPADPAC